MRQNPEWQFGIWLQLTQRCQLSVSFHLMHPIFVYYRGDTSSKVFRIKSLIFFFNFSKFACRVLISFRSFFVIWSRSLFLQKNNHKQLEFHFQDLFVYLFIYFALIWNFICQWSSCLFWLWKFFLFTVNWYYSVSLNRDWIGGDVIVWSFWGTASLI